MFWPVQRNESELFEESLKSSDSKGVVTLSFFFLKIYFVS